MFIIASISLYAELVSLSITLILSLIIITFAFRDEMFDLFILLRFYIILLVFPSGLCENFAFIDVWADIDYLFLFLCVYIVF